MQRHWAQSLVKQQNKTKHPNNKKLQFTDSLLWADSCVNALNGSFFGLSEQVCEKGVLLLLEEKNRLVQDTQLILRVRAGTRTWLAGVCIPLMASLFGVGQNLVGYAGRGVVRHWQKFKV